MSSDDPFQRSETDHPTQEAPLPDDLLNEIDLALDDLTAAPVTEDPQETAPPLHPEGLSDDPGIREMQEIYLTMARAVLRPIDRYIKALSLDAEARELLELSDLMVTPLIPKTETVGLKEHTEDLILFRSLILFALGERDSVSFEAMKKVVVRGFEKLQRRFEFESLRGSRPAVRNVVTFYRTLMADESIGNEDVQKLFSIGIPSITWIRRTAMDELASLSGIETDKVKKVQKIAATYRFRAATDEAMTSATNVLPPAHRREEEGLAAEDGFDSEVLIDTTSLADAIYPVREIT